MLVITNSSVNRLWVNFLATDRQLISTVLWIEWWIFDSKIQVSLMVYRLISRLPFEIFMCNFWGESFVLWFKFHCVLFRWIQFTEPMISQSTDAYIEDILPKGPYPPCLRMVDRAPLAGYPRHGYGHHRAYILLSPNTNVTKPKLINEIL